MEIFEQRCTKHTQGFFKPLNSKYNRCISTLYNDHIQWLEDIEPSLNLTNLWIACKTNNMLSIFITQTWRVLNYVTILSMVQPFIDSWRKEKPKCFKNSCDNQLSRSQNNLPSYHWHEICIITNHPHSGLRQWSYSGGHPNGLNNLHFCQEKTPSWLIFNHEVPVLTESRLCRTKNWHENKYNIQQWEQGRLTHLKIRSTETSSDILVIQHLNLKRKVLLQIFHNHD